MHGGCEKHFFEYEGYLDFNNEKVLVSKYLHWPARRESIGRFQIVKEKEFIIKKN